MKPASATALHPGDARDEWFRRTLVARQLLGTIEEAHAEHGDDWAAHLGGSVLVDDPTELLLALVESFLKTGDELVDELSEWHESAFRGRFVAVADVPPDVLPRIRRRAGEA